MKREEFIEFLHSCIKDEFVATTSVTDNEIIIRFVDGTTYSILIKSVQKNCG